MGRCSSWAVTRSGVAAKGWATPHRDDSGAARKGDLAGRHEAEALVEALVPGRGRLEVGGQLVGVALLEAPSQQPMAESSTLLCRVSGGIDEIPVRLTGVTVLDLGERGEPAQHGGRLSTEGRDEIGNLRELAPRRVFQWPGGSQIATPTTSPSTSASSVA
jgi:hypothetical protein